MADYFWTEHAKFKMKQYALSEQKVRSALRKPFRVEEGIVKNTIAVMIPTGKFVVPREGEKPAWKQELWVMYQLKRKIKSKKPKESKKILNSRFMIHNSANPQIRVISAWRYPGVSPKNNPIPEDILREISKMD